MGVGVETRGWRGGDPVMLSISVLMLSLALLPTSHAVLNMGNPDAKRLYDDLLSNYNKLVRPVQNTTDPLTVRIKLKLSQLIDVVSSQFYLLHISYHIPGQTLAIITQPLTFISSQISPGISLDCFSSNIQFVIISSREERAREREREREYADTCSSSAWLL